MIAPATHYNLDSYAFLRENDLFIDWETACGRHSAEPMKKWKTKVPISTRLFNQLRPLPTGHRYNFKLQQEFALEKVRQQVAPQKPSRLDGIFLFESLDNALNASTRWDGGHFKERNLVKVALEAFNICRVDSEWITFYLNKPETGTEWMQSYWRGETLGVQPLTETIAYGNGRVADTLYCEKVYNNMIERFPESSPLLAACRLAVERGFHSAGRIIPYIEKVEGTYHCRQSIVMTDLYDGSEFINQWNENNWKLPRHTPNVRSGFKPLDFSAFWFQV